MAIAVLALRRWAKNERTKSFSKRCRPLKCDQVFLGLKCETRLSCLQSSCSSSVTCCGSWTSLPRPQYLEIYGSERPNPMEIVNIGTCRISFEHF
jgi:hypothetical protein